MSSRKTLGSLVMPLSSLSSRTQTEVHTLELNRNDTNEEGAFALAVSLANEDCTLHTLRLGLSCVGKKAKLALAKA